MPKSAGQFAKKSPILSSRLTVDTGYLYAISQTPDCKSLPEDKGLHLPMSMCRRQGKCPWQSFRTLGMICAEPMLGFGS